MNISAELSVFLHDMEFPATKDDLLREAARDGVASVDVDLLQSLPDQSYSGGWHVRRHIAAMRPRAVEPALAA